MYLCYINLGKPSSAEKQKNAFMQITSGLGYNPDTRPVSENRIMDAEARWADAVLLHLALFDDRVRPYRPQSPSMER